VACLLILGDELAAYLFNHDHITALTVKRVFSLYNYGAYSLIKSGVMRPLDSGEA
jgi:hypothetical protein